MSSLLPHHSQAQARHRTLTSRPTEGPSLLPGLSLLHYQEISEVLSTFFYLKPSQNISRGLGVFPGRGFSGCVAWLQVDGPGLAPQPPVLDPGLGVPVRLRVEAPLVPPSSFPRLDSGRRWRTSLYPEKGRGRLGSTVCFPASPRPPKQGSTVAQARMCTHLSVLGVGRLGPPAGAGISPGPAFPGLMGEAPWCPASQATCSGSVPHSAVCVSCPLLK